MYVFISCVQNSVFECVLDYAQLLTLKNKLKKIIDEEKDSVRFYMLGNNYKEKVDHIGAMKGIDVANPLIF